MLNIMPPPYPDELFYSWIARYSIKCGPRNSKKINMGLFGKNYINANPVYPTNLDYFVNQLPKNMDISFDSIIENHTIIPFSRLFVKEFDYINLISLLRMSTRAKIENMMGFKDGNLGRNNVIRVCLDCSTIDIDKYGELYAHRIHQIPGNFVCLKHMKFLHEISFDKAPHRDKFIDINNYQVNVKQNESNISSEYINLSKDIENIIYCCNKQEHNLDFLRHKYDNVLKIKGYKSPGGLIFRKSLIEDFKAFYSENFLKRLNSNLDLNDRHNWMVKITKNEGIVHPIRYLLLIRFLFGSVEEFLKFEDDYQPFGKGPWPCMNPVSNHYKNDTITKCDVYRNKHTKGINGRFYCDCGFVYTRKESDDYNRDKYNISQYIEVGPIWEAKLKELIITENYTITDISAIMQCSSETVIRHAARLGIKEKLCTIVKTIEPKDNLALNLLEKHKKQIKEFIIKHPNKSRTQISKELDTAYRYVIKNDRVWMDKILPEPRRYINSFDYQRKDDEIQGIVTNAINELMNNEKPIKITISSIARKANYSMLANKAFTDKLPCTKKIIEKSLETNEQFKLRKLKYVVKKLLISNLKINKSNIARYIEITMDDYIKFKAYIDEAIFENSNQKNYYE